MPGFAWVQPGRIKNTTNDNHVVLDTDKLNK